MRKIHEYLTDLWHPDGSPAIIARDKIKEARELPGGCVELVEFGGRRHTVKAMNKNHKRELLAMWWRTYE